MPPIINVHTRNHTRGIHPDAAGFFMSGPRWRWPHPAVAGDGPPRSQLGTHSRAGGATMGDRLPRGFPRPSRRSTGAVKLSDWPRWWQWPRCQPADRWGRTCAMTPGGLNSQPNSRSVLW